MIRATGVPFLRNTDGNTSFGHLGLQITEQRENIIKLIKKDAISALRNRFGS